MYRRGPAALAASDTRASVALSRFWWCWIGVGRGQLGVILCPVDVCADLRIVDVTEPPGFHNPFKCPRRDVFDYAIHQAVVAKRRPWQIWKPSVEDLVASFPVKDTEAMRAVRDGFGPDEAPECRRVCAYHQVDWIDVAARACELVETHGALLREETIESTAKELGHLEGAFLWSLFENPIKWHPSSPTITNGQHRACGLVVGKAKRVPVAPGPRALRG